MTRSEFLCLTKGTKVKVDEKSGVVRRIDESDMDVLVEFPNGGEDWIHYSLVNLMGTSPGDPIQPAEALRAINHYRDTKAQRKLNPTEARWTNDDILDEYKRLVSLGKIRP